MYYKLAFLERELEWEFYTAVLVEEVFLLNYQAVS